MTGHTLTSMQIKRYAKSPDMPLNLAAVKQLGIKGEVGLRKRFVYGKGGGLEDQSGREAYGVGESTDTVVGEAGKWCVKGVTIKSLGGMGEEI